MASSSGWRLSESLRNRPLQMERDCALCIHRKRCWSCPSGNLLLTKQEISMANPGRRIKECRMTHYPQSTQMVISTAPLGGWRGQLLCRLRVVWEITP